MTSVPARHDLLADLAAGRLAPRDMAGLAAADIDAVLDLAELQMNAGRPFEAARLFQFLAALEPDVVDHLLRLAEAEVQSGREEDALRTLSAYLGQSHGRTDAGRAWALLVRADLVESRDATLARRDRDAAHALARTSEAARAVVRRTEGKAG